VSFLLRQGVADSSVAGRSRIRLLYLVEMQARLGI